MSAHPLTTLLEDLGNRAIRIPKWRWIAGMVDTRGTRVLVDPDEDGNVYIGWEKEGEWETGLYHVVDLTIPDFSDAATVGCFIELVKAVCNGVLPIGVEQISWWGVSSSNSIYFLLEAMENAS